MRSDGKLQTSLEFLIILAIVSALSLSAILLYKNVAAGSKSVLYGINALKINGTLNETVLMNSGEDPRISIYFPINSTLDSKNTMQIDAYGCSNGLALYLLSSNSIAFSNQNMTAAISGISVINETFEPFSEGSDSAILHYAINCTNAIISGTYSLETYSTSAKPSSGSAPQQYYALISSRNESIIYPINDTENIANMTQFNHCSYVSFFGVTNPVSSQCGTPNAYDYIMFDEGCLAPEYPYSRAYCIVPSQSKYGIISGYGQPKYSFSLSISTNLGVLNSSFFNSNASDVYLGNEVVGKALITNFYSESSQTPQSIISNGSTYELANYSAYTQFEQDKNALYSMLAYYNGSAISGDIQSGIRQSLFAFSKSARTLIGAFGPESSQERCGLTGAYYTCKANVPFTYNIYVNTTMPLINQTLSYSGSVIRLTS